MRLHRFAHHAPSTNGAPQVIATLFAAMLILTILLPIAEVSLEGSMSPRNLVQLISSEAGFNIFALLLLILPVIGIGEAMLARSAWRGASAVVAFVALALLFLVLFLLDRAGGDGRWHRKCDARYWRVHIPDRLSDHFDDHKYCSISS
jgi:hypothetical protein